MGQLRFRGIVIGVWAVWLLVFATSPAAAAQVSWRKDFTKAVHEATLAKKPILLEITASWCGYCHRMLETTFTNEQIVRHVNGCFVPVAIDADVHKRLVERIGVEGLPTTVILTPELKILKKITGYKTAEELERHLEMICRPEPRQTVSRPASPPRVVQAPRFAFERLCLVSLRDSVTLQTGSTEQTVTHEGQTLCFASAEHKRRFLADPERYWPLWDGHCVVTAVEERVKRLGDPKWGVLYRGRMWFFADKSGRDKFIRTPAAFLRESGN